MLVLPVNDCVGHQIWDGNQWTTFRCSRDESRIRPVVVHIDERPVLIVELVGCCGSTDYTCLRAEVEEAIEPYGRVTSSITSQFAFEIWPRRYYWMVCHCGRSVAEGGRYCSVECFLKYAPSRFTNEMACKLCGAFTGEMREGFETISSYSIRPHAEKKWRRYFDAISERTGCYLGYLAHWQFCSRTCCLLAARAVIENEKIERELKCLRKINRLMTLTRRSLKKHDREAWNTLEEEFQQVATLQG